MILLDVIKGPGKVQCNDELLIVQYSLEIYEVEIRGWVRPWCGREGDELTLQMQDGSSLGFRFADTTGAIAAASSEIIAVQEPKSASAS